MAEWHFYASGPDKANEKKLWTTGTDAEKKLITDKIQTALAWQQQTGIPTWVGAWMPGNYNKGNTYSVEEQTVFAGFMTKALSDAGIQIQSIIMRKRIHGSRPCSRFLTRISKNSPTSIGGEMNCYLLHSAIVGM